MEHTALGDMIEMKIAQTKDGIDDPEVNRFYTPLSVAKEEIWKRWNNKDLKKEVDKFLGNDIPEALRNEPHAVLLRYIATPNFEAKFFLDLAKESGINPIFGEFLGDKFCTWNQDKLHLAKMTFFHSTDNHSHPKITKKTIINIEKNDGEILDRIEMIQGGKLTDFHHKILCMEYPNANTFDAYALRAGSRSVIDYYEKVFSIFLCYGILFENFILKDKCQEKVFVKTVVLPAYKNTIERFGFKPLIFPVLPIEDEDSNEWMWYSSQVENEIVSV